MSVRYSQVFSLSKYNLDSEKMLVYLADVKMEQAMSPDLLFQSANTLALAGWGLLIAARALPRRWQDLAIAGGARVIPALLSVGYAAILLVHWSTAPGGFGSLPDVMALFTAPMVALAGWAHYLAFDLFVGGWVVTQGRDCAVPWPVMLPVLILTFLFGPAGYLAAVALALVFPERTPT
jgi:Domain of unknown function (DUF4281)